MMLNHNNKKPVILIIDDVPENLQILYKILSEEGYSFSMATTGEETFSILEKQIPDLILLDILLPDTNGFEVIKKIKSNERTKNIPVIFLTAKTENEDRSKAFSLGAVDYVTKPFEEEEVLIRVKTQIMLSLLKKELKKTISVDDERFKLFELDKI